MARPSASWINRWHAIRQNLPFGEPQRLIADSSAVHHSPVFSLSRASYSDQQAIVRGSNSTKSGTGVFPRRRKLRSLDLGRPKTWGWRRQKGSRRRFQLQPLTKLPLFCSSNIVIAAKERWQTRQRRESRPLAASSARLVCLPSAAWLPVPTSHVCRARSLSSQVRYTTQFPTLESSNS